MPLAAGTRLGPYEVLGLIGAGGMGEVYKTRDTRLDRTVADRVPQSALSSGRDRRSCQHWSGLGRHAGPGGSAQKTETHGRPPVQCRGSSSRLETRQQTRRRTCFF